MQDTALGFEVDGEHMASFATAGLKIGLMAVGPWGLQEGPGRQIGTGIARELNYNASEQRSRLESPKIWMNPLD